MDRDKKSTSLLKDAKRKLAEIRSAMLRGDRSKAVQLAAERYQLLKQIGSLNELVSQP